MATTFTTRLNLAKQDLGDNPGAWHTPLNDGFDDADDRLLQVISIADDKTPNTHEAGDLSVLAHFEGQRLWDSKRFAWWTAKTAGAVGTAEWVPDNAPGEVKMFSGAIASIPDGWQLCDGAAVDINSTIGSNVPDLSGKFIAGYAGSGDYANVGDVGGAETVTLEDDEVPGVQNFVGSTGVGGGSSQSGFDGAKFNYAVPNHTHSMNHGHSLEAAASSSHENRPPFYTLAFMVKL